MTKFFAGYTARSAYEGGVGSKIANVGAFEAVLSKAVETFDFTTANPNVRTEGQGFLPLPEAVAFVAAGVGRKVSEPESYVLREWRGTVKAFLKRSLAVQAETLAVVVYTGEAYLVALDGPDTPADVAASERTAFEASGATHVVVAVLAGAGPEALSAGRLVSNLADGNADTLTWTIEEIRQKAREAVAYGEEWSVCAD